MFFYAIGIKIYILLIYLVSPFNRKASKAIKGRKNFFRENPPDENAKYIWFHVASLGEFEQGRPIIEKIKKQNPEKKILLSFFSPSGFEVRKNYEFADKVIYLPYDSRSRAIKFFRHFNIEMAVFVKYDLWPFILQEAFNKNIPVFLTSAVFRRDHFFFKWYGRFFLNLLKRMKRIYVQNEDSTELAKEFGLENVEKTGDVRVDRVIEIKEKIEKIQQIERFLEGKKCIVFGSVYDYEAILIQSILNDTSSDIKIIIAPHNVEDSVLNTFKIAFPESVFYNDIDRFKNERILIIDHVGSLNRIYQYAEMAYVGGGFCRKGIHNILEPAVFNIPVFFGPHHNKFPEASSLVKEHLVFVENSAPGLAKTMAFKLKESVPINFLQNSQKWFVENSGATNLIHKDLSSLF